MSTTQIIVSVVASLAIGGAAGVGITREFTTSVQVSCATPPAPNDDFAKFVKPPMTGFKTYP